MGRLVIEIDIREGLEETIDSSDIEKILQGFLTYLFEGERSLSVYLTDDEEIRQFNLKQRGMDRPTDILSWSYYEEDPEVEWVGDLMLSLPPCTTPGGGKRLGSENRTGPHVGPRLCSSGGLGS